MYSTPKSDIKTLDLYSCKAGCKSYVSHSNKQNDWNNSNLSLTVENFLLSNFERVSYWAFNHIL